MAEQGVATRRGHRRQRDDQDVGARHARDIAAMGRSYDASIKGAQPVVTPSDNPTSGARIMQA
jgi:hypothetical protein